ncbi:MAG: hypothetical protein K2N13_00575 [Paraprevotella sp.]|nr:hypothetical protein [Paraprevotella sp.]
MQLKKLLIVAFLILPLTSFASDFPWLTFLLSDNSELSVAADNLELNYNNGNLHLTSNTVDLEIPVSQIRSMRFTSLASNIGDINAMRPVPVELYTVAGTKVGRFTSIDEARKALPSDVYIGKSETKTYKIIF